MIKVISNYTQVSKIKYVRINVFDIPFGRCAKILPGTATEGFIESCEFAELVTLSVSATDITIDDPLCSSSSDRLFAVDTANNDNGKKYYFHIHKNLENTINATESDTKTPLRG